MRSLLLNKYLWSLTLGHFSIDLYAGAMPVVLAALAGSMHLSFEQVGLVSALYTLCSSVSQPFFGYLSDRFGGRSFASIGLVWMSILQGAIGFVPDYPTLLVLAPLAGFGSAAFHPQGASSANIASGERKTAGMAIFLLGGNGGFAVGPLIAGLIIGGMALTGSLVLPGMGTHGTAVIAIFGLLIAPVLFFISRSSATAASAQRLPHAGARVSTNKAFSKFAIIALMLVATLRAWEQSSVSLYVPPFFMSSAAMTLAEASRVSALILGSLALGTFFGGFLSDHVDGRVVMVISFLISAPATIALFTAQGTNTYLAAVVLGISLGSAWPPTLVLAQALFPRHAGIGSGLALGFVFAMGGLGNYVTGFLAERIGLLNSLLVLAALPLLAALFTFALPSHKAVARGAQIARAGADVVSAEPVRS